MIPLLKHIPDEFIASINNSEMKITLINGSILRVVWTDKNIDWVVGSNPVWIIFSERALCNPIVWDYMKPMLMGNGWRAYFVYTPRWHNHWYDIAMTAEKFTDTRAYWFTTAKDTYDSNWERIFSDIQLQDELDQWMDPDLWEQEYMCSFEAAMKWAVYSDQFKKALDEKRICKVPHEEWLQTYTFWDLWMADTTAIWFVQLYGKEIRIIDHYEMSGKSLDHYVDIINAKGYNYKWHYLPHDSRVRELISWTSRIDYLEKAGLTNIKITPNISVDQGIDATRRNFKNMWFDSENCERWLLALKSYVYSYDEKNKMWSRTPKHDWASNSADALRYLWVVLEEISKISKPQKAFTVDYSKFL